MKGVFMNKSIVTGMTSPLTGGAVYLWEGTEVQTFRGEEYTVHARYYECKDTGEKFTSEEQDEQLFCELYNQYRVRHGIPFPEEIKATRERYGLSCQQMSTIVGFGQNQWGQYENGKMPSESNGKSIAAIKNRNCMLTMLEASKNEFDERTYTKIKNSILCAPDYNIQDNRNIYFYGQTIRGPYNGYSDMNATKLQSMVQTIVSMEKNGVSKTKLNKEMFYADFLCYKKHGRSISGLTYRAIQYGAVPEHYETVYDHVEGLQRKIVGGDMEYELLSCDAPDTSPLSKEECKVIQYVMALLTTKTCSEVVKLNHEEDGWLKNKDSHSFIPYDEAFSLKAF